MASRFNLIDFLHSLLAPFKAMNYSNLDFSESFSVEERTAMIEYLKECGQCPADHYNLDFYWNNKMGESCDACWDYRQEDNIFFSNDRHFDYRMDGFKKLVRDCVHEIEHRKQHRVLKLFYFIFTIPVVRNFTIEIFANKAGARAGRYFKLEDI